MCNTYVMLFDITMSVVSVEIGEELFYAPKAGETVRERRREREGERATAFSTHHLKFSLILRTNSIVVV